MEKRAARLISAFIKSGRIAGNTFMVLQNDQEELEQELAKLLEQASKIGKQSGYAMVERQERAVSAKDVAIGTALYLFLKRAKDIVSGIVERVRGIVSDVIDRGGTADDAQDTVAELVDYLPETIASTEIHTEVEQAIADVFEQEGIEKVEWVTEPGACPLCLANEEAGPIERSEVFPSGDTEPPAHPRCRCNLVPALEINGE